MAAPTVLDPPTRDIGVPDLSWGTWGQGLLSDWWETAADLIWPQSVVTYGRMRHDPVLRGVIQALTLPVLRANWAIDPAGCRDEVVQLVADDLGLPITGAEDEPTAARRRGVIWLRHLREALFSLIYGHMPFERRYDVTSGQCRLVNLGPRMPWTIAQINLAHDASVQTIVQTTQPEPIPGNRLVWYSYGQEGANWAGISLLRPAFGAWLLKHEMWRVHGTSIRRFGMGVPVVEAPPGATVGQVTQAQQLASSMRAGDQSGAGIPSGFKFLLTGMTGSAPDAMGFITYLDQQMSKMALAALLELGQTETGSRALGESFLDLLLLSLQTIADEISTVATSGQTGMPGIVTDLVDQNWGPDEPAPAVVCTGIGESYAVTAEALGHLTEFGTLSPDANLDAYIRKTWKLPKRAGVWQPTTRGLPAPGQPGGAFLAPGATPTPALPGQSVPAWTPPAPPEPPPAPPVSDTVPAAAPPAGLTTAAAGRWQRQWRVRAAEAGLRRNLTPLEVRAGFDPLAVQADFQSELDMLLAQWPSLVFRPIRDSLVDQVAAMVDQGRLDKLPSLTADTAQGAVLIRDAMNRLAQTAADRMLAEAAHQGVTITASRVKVPAPKLSKIAVARAAMAGAYVVAQASAKALQVATTSDGAQTADQVQVFLDGLSQVSARDQLSAALTAAQNAGRFAVLDIAPGAAYVASEITDTNCCEKCLDEDGTEFATLDDAEAAYPSGGYAECEGGMRCRGTVVASWDGA